MFPAIRPQLLRRYRRVAAVRVRRDGANQSTTSPGQGQLRRQVPTQKSDLRAHAPPSSSLLNIERSGESAVRWSAVGGCTDRQRRRDGRQWSSDAGPAFRDPDVAGSDRDDGVEPMRRALSYGCEEPWPDATRPQVCRDGTRFITSQRIKTMSRGQISAHAAGIHTANECDADDEGCETLRGQHYAVFRSQRHACRRYAVSRVQSGRSIR